jgi:hypothetical protein
MRSLQFVCVLTLLCAAVRAQSFINDTTSIPQGAPFNANDSEQVDFGDVDGDGDIDVAIATGGDSGNQQNRIWINRGGAQGGAVGVFLDETATRFPAVLDTSRDMDFVDFDGDGDLDLCTASTASWQNQPSRFWTNMGGVQGGSPGFYADQTASRWSGLGAAGSSVATSLVLASGGYIDWTSDLDLGDFDDDGDADLFHTSVGAASGGFVPTRVFLNDGLGVFSEFNPSGFQLTSYNILDHDPGLWCQGLQKNATTNTTGAECDIADGVIDSDLGDLDGDFDLDIVWCSAIGSRPRVFRNRLVEQGGALAFRDVTAASFASGYPTFNGSYEQELGDIDDDGDLDLYGLNWSPSGAGFDDETLLNSGAGVFAFGNILPASTADDEEADFIDYDGDGDLDVHVANFAGQDRLYKNGSIGGGATWTNVTATIPVEFLEGRDADCCDVDGDGDTDVFVANGAGQADLFFRNVTQVADARAPRITALEQAPSRQAGPAPTIVRAHIYDNGPDYITAFDANLLEYSVSGAPFVTVNMTWIGGQLFRGAIPGAPVGTIAYRVRSTDARGNAGLSATKVYLSGVPTNYCTAGTTSNGCLASISGSGVPSASSTSGFTLTVASVEGASNGLILYGISGRTLQAWGAGSSSLCVQQPLQRTGVQNSGGVATQCNGAFSLDWNAYRASHPSALGNPFSVGQVVDAQGWFRDPPSPKTTSLSDALEFIVQP